MSRESGMQLGAFVMINVRLWNRDLAGLNQCETHPYGMFLSRYFEGRSVVVPP